MFPQMCSETLVGPLYSRFLSVTRQMNATETSKTFVKKLVGGVFDELYNDEELSILSEFLRLDQCWVSLVDLKQK